jgi:choline-sulfatase
VSERPPDVVVFMTDQQRHDQVGYAGGQFETPVLDGLAERGVVFDTAYSPAPVCVPARMSLLTGMAPHRLPRQGESLALAEGHWTVAHALADAGYETALVGKMHLTPVHARHGFQTMRMCEDLYEAGGYPRGTVDDYGEWLVAHGFRDWRDSLWSGREPDPEVPTLGPFLYGPEAHPTGWIEREVLELLDRRDRDRPLFLVVSFPSPHPPWNPPEPYASRYALDDVELPSDGFEVNRELPDVFVDALTAAPQRAQSELQTRRVLTMVRGLVRHIDDAMGRIVEQLDLGRTTCFFTSDHGDYAGHRGLLMKQPWIPFDDLARVPFVATGSAVAGGRRFGQPVSTIDLAPTILEVAGVTPPAGDLDGASLAGVLADPDAAPGADRLVVCGSSTGWSMARRGRFKCIGRSDPQSVVLFDMLDDPGERHDLAPDPAHATTLAGIGAGLLTYLFEPREAPPLRP